MVKRRVLEEEEKRRKEPIKFLNVKSLVYN